MPIAVAQSLIPSTAQAPLDARTVVATLADIANVDNPYVGLEIYVTATGKKYRVATLTETTIGTRTVYTVGTYEAIPDAADVAAMETAISGKAPANHTHDFGAYAEVTKFEVYATNAVISAGTVDSDTGLAYAEDVPAGMSHYFRLRSDTPQASQDVVIDWGDGSSSSLHDGDFDSIDDSEWISAGEVIYNVHHTYSTPGKYIVTVNGKGYWGFQTGPFTNGGASILSRIFASDLPLASWVMNLAGCCNNSPKLQRVLIPTGMDMFANIHNASSIFTNCVNLLSATNFETKFQYTRYVLCIFKGCRNMTTCDFRMPQNTIRPNAYTSCFEGCAALTANIADLLPERGFDGVNVDISRCFYGCASLTGTVPASILWNDMRVNWTHANTFTGCSAAILSQVPESWGGTASEVEDPHPITRSQVTSVIADKVDEAVQNLSIPASGGTGNILGGYAVKATAYNASTYTLTLDPGEENDETDMAKFVPGTRAYVNELTDDVEDDPETPSENEDVWGAYKSAEIASVDAVNHKITFTEDIGMTTSNALENIICRVSDASRKDAAFSSGDRNFVTGEAASADGLINTVSGTGSKVTGSMNFVSGHLSGAEGVGNTVTGNRSFAVGGNNKVSGDMNFVTGNGNEIAGQGAEVLGSGNRDVTGVDVKIIGDGNKAAGNRVNVIGFHNEVSGNESSVLGNGLKVAAQKAVLIGQRGELADTPENKGAVAIAGGDAEDGTKEISFIHRARKVDPLDETNTEPAFSHEYRGRLKAVTQTISTVGTVELDHDQYARWELTGTGTVTLTLSNWQDGDRGEVVIDTTKQTFTIPAAWIVPDSVWDAWTTAPGKYCMEIRQEGGAVFAHAAVPFNAGGTFNVVVSSAQPANPVEGTIWIQE